MSNIIFTKTAQGTRLLHIENFTFRRNKEVAGKEYWSCENNCGAHCITSERIVQSLFNEHGHSNDKAKVQRLVAINEMKNLLDESSTLTLRKSYESVMRRLRSGTDEEKETAGKFSIDMRVEMLYN